MPTPIVVSLAVEGDVDAAVATRVLHSQGLETGPIFGRRGKPYLDQKLNGFNRAAQFAPWLVLRDLDRDADCPPSFLRALSFEPAPGMRFRLVVRSIESWILGDHEKFAQLLGISRQILPRDPETLADPKRALLQLATRARSRNLRQRLLPAQGSTATVGPEYNAQLQEFVYDHWRPDVAAKRCPSLERCLRALQYSP